MSLSAVSELAAREYRVAQSERWRRYYEKRLLSSIAHRGDQFVERDQQILEMRRAGVSTPQIAAQFGLTRGRVWQICAKAVRIASETCGVSRPR